MAKGRKRDKKRNKPGDPYRSIRRLAAPPGHAFLTGKEYSRRNKKRDIEKEIAIDEN